MKTRLITLLIAISAIIGSAYAQEYDRVIELYKGGELIHKYKVSELDSIKFNKEYKYSVSATITPSNGGTVTINGATGTQYISEGGTATFEATPNSGYKFKNWTLNGNVVSTQNPYTATITANLTLIATFEEQTVPTPGTNNGHAYVDLGLSVKWATCNVGATTPEGYGNYFAWGETTPKTTYDFDTYKYCGGSSSSFTKYCTNPNEGRVDNKTTLELLDDAARVNWGGSWRMPTDDELSELRNTNNCTWTWTTQNGVKGYKVTSKKNGNSIFLPAAGYRDYRGSLSGAGSYGGYWSSSLKSSNNFAYVEEFSSDDVVRYVGSRCDGLSVRAVCDTIYTDTCSVIVSTSNKTMGSVESSSTSVIKGGIVTLTATPNTPNGDYGFVNWTVDGVVVSTENPYTAIITTDTEFTANFIKYYIPTGVENGHEYVDLGLSVKWATCNVGATSPKEYGDYFAWGETTPKTTYNWSTYKYCNGTYDSMTKYCTDSEYGIVDNKTTLELSDDAAHVNWGGSWRMPTDDELSELRNRNNCTWEWTTLNGVNGYRVISKKNGNSIFLPAAGYRSYSYLADAGSYGGYWVTSLHDDDFYDDYAANGVYFAPSDQYPIWGYDICRDDGLSVRAVCE